MTWHVISDLVEDGDILKQVAIDIADGDTAFTLNGKCYEAAIRSFEELVDELSSGQALAIPNWVERIWTASWVLV